MKDPDKMVRVGQVKAPESHLYGASPPVYWLSDMTAFQTDHRNEHILPHFTKHTVMVTGEDKTLEQRQALERLWLIPRPSVTIFKNCDWRALNSIFKILRFPLWQPSAPVCSSCQKGTAGSVWQESKYTPETPLKDGPQGTELNPG